MPFFCQSIQEPIHGQQPANLNILSVHCSVWGLNLNGNNLAEAELSRPTYRRESGERAYVPQYLCASLQSLHCNSYFLHLY